jgi:hypothetical protein
MIYEYSSAVLKRNTWLLNETVYQGALLTDPEFHKWLCNFNLLIIFTPFVCIGTILVAYIKLGYVRQ